MKRLLNRTPKKDAQQRPYIDDEPTTSGLSDLNGAEQHQSNGHTDGHLIDGDHAERQGGLHLPFGRRDVARRPAATAGGRYHVRGPPPVSNSPEQVVSVIGWLCGTGQDDWETALRLCDDISTSQDLSKAAARGLRRELEHGQPEPQERAARLLVILSRNAGDRFRLQLAQKKFIDVVDKVLKSPRTLPSVKNMLHKSLSVLAFENQQDRDMAPLIGLYNRIKRPEDPFNGSELDAEDPVFSPTDMPRRHRSRRQQGQQPANLDAQVQAAKSNAAMLSEALSFTKPEDMDQNDLIGEFYQKCQESQTQMVDAISWATSRAEDARRSRGDSEAPHDGQTPQSPEDEVLRSLQSANQELVNVFRMHDDMQRKRREEEDEREARQRSVTDTKYHRAGSDTLTIPNNGIWASGSSENLVQASSSREGSRRGSAQDENLAPPTLPAPILPSLSPAVPFQQSPPRRTNPYLTALSASPPPLQNDYVQQTPPKPLNPFTKQPLSAVAAPTHADAFSLPSDMSPFEAPLSNTIVEEPESLPGSVAPFTTATPPVRAGPPSAPSSGTNPYTASRPLRGSLGSDGSVRSSSTNPYLSRLAATPPPSAMEAAGAAVTSTPTRQTTGGIDEEEPSTPVEPSAKALGKLRRFSTDQDLAATSNSDVRQHDLENQLRQKYIDAAEEKRRNQSPPQSFL